MTGMVRFVKGMKPAFLRFAEFFLQYSRSFYRATYVNTAFDAAFASAMSIRPKWLKDIASVAFTAYYLVFARQADETVRLFAPRFSVIVCSRLS
jgi:hypothetical protein